MEPCQGWPIKVDHENLTQERIVSHIRGYNMAIVYNMITRIKDTIIHSEVMNDKISRRVVLEDMQANDVHNMSLKFCF